MKAIPPARRQEGYTILELLAALAIFGLIIGAIYSFYLAGLNSWNRGIVQMDSQQSARIAMDKMIRELRYASAVELQSDEEIRFQLTGDTKTYLFRKSGRELIFESKLNNSTKSHNKIALG
ncbi:MAG: prepilin-type N-terminal cleavage/methylation domain-containing protein, partial [Bacillota bacterium]